MQMSKMFTRPKSATLFGTAFNFLRLALLPLFSMYFSVTNKSTNYGQDYGINRISLHKPKEHRKSIKSVRIGSPERRSWFKRGNCTTRRKAPVALSAIF